jgi:hypothetical protein
MTVPLCYYGSPEPLPRRRELRAGPLTAVYEAGDLRYVRVGGVEVCRRWYAAVRDANWGTVPGVITDEVIEQRDDSFSVRYTSTHRRGDIDFVWRAKILGTPTFVLFSFDGKARSDFSRNRIGFCVLHPPETCGGRAVTLHHPDGSKTNTWFPDRIAPTNPYCELTRLDHDSPAGRVEWRFVGDVFETEDQRNWIDASFKTFCTPLRLPFPVEVKAGERVQQIVTMAVHQPDARARVVEESTPSLARRAGDCPNLPLIGLCLAADAEPLTDREAAVLSALGPQFLVAAVWPDAPGWPDRWRRDLAAADALDTLIVPALYVSADVPPDVASVLYHRRVRTVHVYQADGWAAPADRIDAVRRLCPGREVVAGTQANFTELNRNRPPLDRLDGVCYSVQPQEHAFDNASLVECCETIGETVRSARAFAGDKPLSVGPITLRKRVNPYATGPAPATPPGELPPTVDPRQMSLFGAGWTLAALKYLAEGGVESVAFYGTVGWRGVMERDGGCPLPDRFPSRPGMAFPLFHVLADANELAGATVRPCRSSDPLRFDALTLEGDRVAVLLANLTAEPLTVTVHDLPPRVRVRVLDETTFDAATADPLGWRADDGPAHDADGGRLVLTLRPYAYARLAGDVPYGR